MPADRPVLVVAEGLFPYLTADQVRRLFQQITDRFPAGEIIFDGVAPWGARLHPLFKWSPGNGRSIERWNPRLTLAEAGSYVAEWRRIPVRRYRAIYRIMMALPGSLGRNAMPAMRFTFG